MKAKRKRHSAQFEAKIALEALKGIQTTQQIAKENQVHPTQVSQWKRHIADRLPELFEGSGAENGGQEDWQREREQLHAKIGKQSVEIDWLAKKCGQLHL